MQKFSVGDKVRIIATSSLNGQPQQNNASGEGIVDKVSGESCRVAFPLLRDASLSYTNTYRFSDLEHSQLQVETKTQKQTGKNIKRIAIEINRDGGLTHFKFEVDPRIEEIYKKLNPEIRESEKWSGLKFYYIPGVISSTEYKKQLERYSMFDDFGSGLYKEGRLNIAWLRTVGGSGEIVVPDQIAFAELSLLVKKAIEFLKQYFDDYYKDFTIKGNLNIEV